MCGELNWLATRTRADLAYVVSLAASTCTHYGAWTEMLCKKIFRYLLGTPEQGIIFPKGPVGVGSAPPGEATAGHKTTEALHPDQLVVWSYAASGGLAQKPKLV